MCITIQNALEKVSVAAYKYAYWIFSALKTQESDRSLKNIFVFKIIQIILKGHFFSFL